MWFNLNISQGKVLRWCMPVLQAENITLIQPELEALHPQAMQVFGE
jgi:hypothetical protein